ncbi:MAG TPA: 2OG-Fe(II) oxygenase [Chryseosolibacter sp.]|nr:2OG-Fe(II) oxygenase [Chryseosolibacter sp.]
MTHISELNWLLIQQSLNDRGYARVPGLLSTDECEAVKALYPQGEIYRNVIDMRRYRFGQGEYKYFAYPLPPVVREIRQQFYPHLAAIGNEWMQLLGEEKIFPHAHEELLDACHRAGQKRPTPLILKYGTGGYNTLHQDLYGDVYFPFQVLLLLSDAATDFTGGEFVIVEQVPRAQSRAHVIHLSRGDALIFTTNFRPARGTRGYYRATMKHGISELHKGERYALGVIFHDAR